MFKVGDRVRDSRNGLTGTIVLVDPEPMTRLHYFVRVDQEGHNFISSVAREIAGTPLEGLWFKDKYTELCQEAEATAHYRTDMYGFKTNDRDWEDKPLGLLW